MPNVITTARGERVDLDVIRIKGQLAQAPMNIEVERRKKFIDTKEEKPKRASYDLTVTNQAIEEALAAIKQESKVESQAAVESFEVEAPAGDKKRK
jgi:hypothetical protein